MCGWDASPTWSGYFYQGKVAIYHMLRLICEDLEAGKKCSLKIEEDCKSTNILAECSNFLMELEQVEDFSIKDKNEKYYSLHQVKAYKSQKTSQYTGAISKIIDNIDNLSIDNHIPKGYMHVIKEVPITYNNGNLSTYEYYVNGKPQKYCGLEEIETIIKEKIVQLNKLLTGRSLSDDDKEALFLTYKNVIDEIVRKRHMDIDEYGKGNFKVEAYQLCCLCKLIDKVKKSKDSYYINKLKNRFIENFERYYFEFLERNLILMDEQTEEELAVTSDKSPKFHKYMGDLWNYYSEGERFKSFCKMITPDYKSNKSLIDDDYSSLIPDKSMEEFYFPITQRLLSSNAEAKSNGVFVIEQKKYIITNITTPIKQSHFNKRENEIYKKQNEYKLRKQILSNPSNIELLFEIDTLISKEIDLEKLYDDHFCDIPEIKINQLEEKLTNDTKTYKMLHDSIVHIKENIEIISSKKLEERLCEL